MDNLSPQDEDLKLMHLELLLNVENLSICHLVQHVFAVSSHSFHSALPKFHSKQDVSCWHD